MKRTPQSGDGPDGGGAPNRRGGVQSPDNARVLEDDAGAQETNSRHDVGNNLTFAAGVAAHHEAARDEGSGAGSNQCVSACARHPLTPLPFQSHPINS